MESVLTDLIPFLVKDGVFGDVEYVSLEPENQTDIGVQFGSSLAFVNLRVRKQSVEEIFPLVIKKQVDSPLAYTHFLNELLIYKEVIPALKLDKKSYPKLYYGHVSEEISKNNVLIFQNLKYKNYRNSKESPFLDFEHISIALRKIAEIHSLSYILKHENQEKFLEFCNKLKIGDFNDPRVIGFEKPHIAAIERGVMAFQKSNGFDEVFESFLNAVKNPSVVVNALKVAEEPVGVICHGDFCNNNVMYKYDDKGSPTDCVIFDFQTSRYGSPAFDLAFYLYMHTTDDTREMYWDEYFKMYWKSLRELVPNHINIPSFQVFMKNFADRAVYGYLISCFFLPMMLDSSARFNLQPIEEKIQIAKTMGGSEAEGRLADIVAHLYHRKYIHSFIHFSRNKILLRS